LLAKAECQMKHSSLTNRFREQARSHRGLDFNSISAVSHPVMNRPAGLLRMLTQHRIRIHHLRVIHFQQQWQIIA
jgi:hypothetical protein